MTTHYRVEVSGRRELLDHWLADAVEDTTHALHALQLLTDADGPQPLDVDANLRAAARTLRACQQALSRDPLAAGGGQSSRSPEWVVRFYADALIDQGHIPGASDLHNGPCVACTDITGQPQQWPCPLAAAAPTGTIEIIADVTYRRLGA